jgi:Putative MetA-pathway of phenol degradation
MLKSTLLGTISVMLVAINATAQGVCPLNGASSKNLICLIPQVYGPFGLSSGGPLKTFFGHEAHFDNDFIAEFRPISVAVGSQVSNLPKASPSSGITFVYDPALKTFAPSTEQTLGPILGERADTIGRNRLYVAFSYQYFNFDSIDGTGLNKVPASFQHQPIQPDFKNTFPCPNQTGLTGPYAGDPCFVRDFIQTSNSVDLKVHQYTLYATYGITSRLDISVAIPILDVRMNVRSNATIVPNSVSNPNPNNVPHQFDPTKVPSCGIASPCLQATFTDSGTTRGIGDVVLRGKYQVYKGERTGLALGIDLRTPTGDDKNFLGSGAVGVKPFGVFSYKARLSPHAELGYEVNGDSILAGNFVGASNSSGSLPNRLIYIVGADAAVTRRLTAAFDLYGQHLFDAPQLKPTLFTDKGKCVDDACNTVDPGTTHPDVTGTTAGSNLLDASLGLKVRAFGKLVLTGNVLIKLNDDGLRAKAVPLVGMGYSF